MATRAAIAAMSAAELYRPGKSQAAQRQAATPRFTPLIKITAVHSQRAIELALPDMLAGIHPVIHPMYLQPAARASTRGTSYADLAAALKPASRVVDTILGHKSIGRGSRKRIFYLVKWRNASFLQSSWVAAGQLGVCQGARTRYAQSGGRDLTKAAVHAASTASVASASLTRTATRSGIVLDDTRDENLWGSVLDWAERAGLFVRAQTANAGDVSGSDRQSRHSQAASAFSLVSKK
jgi:hypothetical protein